MKMTAGSVGETYKKAIGDNLKKYNDTADIRIKTSYEIHKDGSLSEEVDLSFLYVGYSKKEYFEWHVPRLSDATCVHIEDFVPGNYAHDLLLNTKDEKNLIICVLLKNVTHGIRASFKIKFIVTGASNVFKSKPHTMVEFPLAFVPANSVTHLEIRILANGQKIYRAENNLNQFSHAHLGDKHILVTSKTGSYIGDVSGSVGVLFENRDFRRLINIVGASGLAIISILLAATKEQFGHWNILIAILLISLWAIIWHQTRSLYH
jgi:hypothetical protein